MWPKKINKKYGAKNGINICRTRIAACSGAILMLLCAGPAGDVWAQEDSVLDQAPGVLSDYTPPPMFGTVDHQESFRLAPTQSPTPVVKPSQREKRVVDVPSSDGVLRTPQRQDQVTLFPSQPSVVSSTPAQTQKLSTQKSFSKRINARNAQPPQKPLTISPDQSELTSLLPHELEAEEKQAAYNLEKEREVERRLSTPSIITSVREPAADPIKEPVKKQISKPINKEAESQIERQKQSVESLSSVETPSSVSTPSARDLLRYKDLAYEETRVAGLPVPARKPENLAEYIAAPPTKRSIQARAKTENTQHKDAELANIEELPAVKPAEVIISSVEPSYTPLSQGRSINKPEVGSAQNPPQKTVASLLKEKAKNLAGAEPAAGVDLPENRPLEHISTDLDGENLPKKNAETIAEDERFLSLAFQKGETQLSSRHKEYIQVRLIEHLKAQSTVRLEIKAFADSQSEDTRSGARRVSLARALAVREYLLTQGIQADRMDLRALGSKTEEPPIDRVDIEMKLI